MRTHIRETVESLLSSVRVRAHLGDILMFSYKYTSGGHSIARLSDDCIELLSDDSIEHLSNDSIECPPDPRQNSYVFLMIEFLCLSNR